LPVIKFRTGNCAFFSKTSSGSGQRPTGRDKGKEVFFVPTPRNPEVLISVPEDAEYPTVPEEEYDEYEEFERNMLKNWKPGDRKRPRQAAYTLEALLEDTPTKETRWSTKNKRCGAVALKLGMMPVWDDWGHRHPCTVLHLDSNVVLRVKTSDGPDGYDAIQIGAGERKLKNVKSAILGQLPPTVRDYPPHIIREFRITPLPTAQVAPPVGTRIHARHFLAGQCVDVSAISKGKGFQGGMKRHNFKGMPASHGTSLSHRAIGSTGQCQDPGRVFKGKKMPGRMGAERVTTQNLRIIKIDRGRNLIYVRGAVPGNKGGFVEIRDAVKRPLFGTVMVEGNAAIPPLPTAIYDDEIDGSMKKGYEVMKPLEEKDPSEIMEEAA